jgi:hypothetical protein
MQHPACNRVGQGLAELGVSALMTITPLGAFYFNPHILSLYLLKTIRVRSLSVSDSLKDVS